MKLSLMRLCHRTPGLRRAAGRISPSWFFAWTRLSVRAAFAVNLRQRRKIRPLIEAILDGSSNHGSVDALAEQYLVYRRWLNHLEYAWQNWASCHKTWIRFEGEEYLAEALQRGKGVFLLSGHYYGFTRLVAPVLAEKGYTVHRTGDARDPYRRDSRWGKQFHRRWRHINYGREFWDHMRALQAIREAMDRNEIVHVSIKLVGQGEPDLEIRFGSQSLFLDRKMFRVIGNFAAPALPCFSLADTQGNLNIIFHPPGGSTADQALQSFRTSYQRYLNDSPQYARMWKKIQTLAEA